MSWNYRVVRLISYNPTTLEPFYGYAIHEVYYGHDDKPEKMSQSDISPGGESRGELAKDWHLYWRALLKPVLVFDSIEGFLDEEEEPMFKDTNELWASNTTSGVITATEKGTK